MGRHTCGIVLLLALSALPAAADEWIRMSAPGIDLYTTAGPKQAKELLQRLQQVRSFFLKASPVRKVSEMPLRIIEFRSQDEFQRFNPNQISSAYFASSKVRDYIVLGPAAEDNFAMVVHEYMHLIVKHSGLRLPVWLNEGWADVYSTLRPQGKETAVGDLLPLRMESLTKEQWLDFDTLTSVTSQSASYNEASRAGIFYAESWALAHMLYLAPDYSANFGRFVAELNAGRSADDACQAAWGRSGAQVMADLRNYFKRKKILGRLYETSLGKDQDEPLPSQLSEFDKSMILADLLTELGKTSEAKAEFERLDLEQPGQAAVARALGDLAAGRRDEDAARSYYEKAFDAGEQDPVMCYDLALLERKKGQAAKMLVALERAVQSKPDYTDAALLLGLTRVNLRNFEGGIAALLAIDEIRPEMAPPVYCALSVAYVQTGDFDAARAHLATCGKWSKTEEEKKRVEQVTAFLNARARPDAAVRKGEKRGAMTGMAIGLDCVPPGMRLRVQVNDKIATFDMPSPAAIEMTPAHGGQLKLQCGAFPPVLVGVEYAPPLTAIGNSAGIVRRLEY